MIALFFATNKELGAGLTGEAGRIPSGRAEVRELGGRQWLVGVSGVGLVNAALLTGQALARFDLEGVVCAGLVGSFDLDTLPLGSLALVGLEIWPEYGLGADGGTDEGMADPRGLGFPLAGLPGGERVWDRVDHPPDAALRALDLGSDPAWPRATALSVSTVTANKDRAEALRRAYGVPGTPLVENMEGFAPALACAKAGLPFVELRAVSNLVGSRRAGDWDLDRALDALGKGVARLMHSPGQP